MEGAVVAGNAVRRHLNGLYPPAQGHGFALVALGAADGKLELVTAPEMQFAVLAALHPQSAQGDAVVEQLQVVALAVEPRAAQSDFAHALRLPVIAADQKDQQ